MDKRDIVSSLKEALHKDIEGCQMVKAVTLLIFSYSSTTNDKTKSIAQNVTKSNRYDVANEICRLVNCSAGDDIATVYSPSSLQIQPNRSDTLIQISIANKEAIDKLIASNIKVEIDNLLSDGNTVPEKSIPLAQPTQ